MRPALAIAPSLSNVPPVMGLHPLVDQRISRPAVIGDDIAFGADKRQIGNAADIDEYQRGCLVGTLGKRGMIDRNERRALPAKCHVMSAHIMHDGNAGSIAPEARHRPVARSQRRIGAVKNGLPVKSDHVYVCWRQPVAG